MSKRKKNEAELKAKKDFDVELNNSGYGAEPLIEHPSDLENMLDRDKGRERTQETRRLRRSIADSHGKFQDGKDTAE
ncbi:hypothetical protein [Novipirellula sp.]|uniref:hypothetical protein n=1 Tax=Novipirellula sp. TaxID=2795430 RepID=UPI003569DE44